MSIKNLFIVICLLTSSFSPAIAVNSSTESISVKENNTQKRTLKDRLLDVWVAKKLKKLDTKAALPPDLKKCLNINLKNRQVHKGYQVTISDNAVAYKKCNSDADEVTEVNLDEIESVTSTDGKLVYFKQPIQKIKTVLGFENAKTHPAVILGLVLTLGGLAASIWFNIIFGLVMVLSGVLLALVTRKLLRRNNKHWKGLSLISVITGLGTGLMLLILSLADKFK